MAGHQTIGSLSSMGRSWVRSCALIMYIDIHSHQPTTRAGVFRVFNLMAGASETPFSAPLDEGLVFSAGVHPWEADSTTTKVWSALENLVIKPEVLMVGEIGLDKLKGPSLEVQKAVFKRQLLLAESVSKPVIIHAVRSSDALMALKKTTTGIPAWIIHGFRGGPVEAANWLSHGFFLSFGPAFNPASLLACPPGRFFLETDEKGDIVALYEQAALVMGWSLDRLVSVVEAAWAGLFPSANNKGRW